MDATMTENSREKKEKATQTYAALGVGFVCLVVGLPLWWKTTEVYRVHLPYSDIQRLHLKKISILTQLTIVVFDESVEKVELAKIGENMKNIMESSETSSPVEFHYKGNIRHPFDEERQVFNKATSLEELDSGLHQIKVLKEHGKFDIVLLPKTCAIAPTKMEVRRRRAVYLTMPDDGNELIKMVKDVLNNVLVAEEDVNKVYVDMKGLQRMKPDRGSDKAEMRSVRSHPGYDITFSLLNPQPGYMAAEWDIVEGINEYLQPFLDSFAEFSELNVKSQYLHYTGLNIRPQQGSDGKYTLKHDDLPHVINPIEGLLGSHVSVNPQLNFIVYIPERGHSPLHILDANGEPSSMNAFLSPRWGGIMIYNLDNPPDGSTLPHQVKVNMRDIMEVFLSQLRLLFGVARENHKQQVNILQPGNNGINLWELDYWLRKRTIENIATASATLRSLVQLLEEVKNIVINDDIGNEVQEAVESIEKSHTLISQGKLKEAYHTSRKAIMASEKAFFDPSLLELLYFPEDQKFAIYIPLFLPISIPVVMSLLQAIKWIKSKKKAGKQE